MISVRDVYKSFANGQVLAGVTFSVDPGETVCLLGPSACGKSTLLNIVGQLDQADHGSVEVSVEDQNRIGYMLQESLLLPWRTLKQNATLGHEIVVPASTPDWALVERLFSEFGMNGTQDFLPVAASAGMKQRVALIRTLLFRPTILLLDEPFSSLDFDIKIAIQRCLLSYQRERQATICLVTHDLEDAIALADRIVVLSGKPTIVKSELRVDLNMRMKDPLVARKSPRFRELFVELLSRVSYLNGDS